MVRVFTEFLTIAIKRLLLLWLPCDCCCSPVIDVAAAVAIVVEGGRWGCGCEVVT